MYWSFFELGPQLLARDHVWFYFGILRTNVAKHVPGGMSTVFGIVMEKLFGTVHNFQATGAVVDLGPYRQSILLKATMGCTIADYAALCQLLNTKTAGGGAPSLASSVTMLP